MELNSDLRDALKQLGLDGVKIKEVKKEVEPLIKREEKAIFGVVTCSLCKTVTKQYVRMEKLENGTWQSGRAYEQSEIEKLTKSKLEVVRETVKSCWSCEKVLLKKDKIELVGMIVKLYAPIPTQREIWKYIGRLRAEAIQDGIKKAKRSRIHKQLEGDSFDPEEM